MNIKQLNQLTHYFILKKSSGISAADKKKLNRIIKSNEDNIHSLIFFEYLHIEIPEEKAILIFKKTIENKKRLDKKAGKRFDFRVAFLDYIIKNVHIIKKDSQIRFIEENALLNLSKLIEKDELTGLYNYRFYEAELKKEYSRSFRNKQPFSLIVLDIDDFKLYNDMFGHNEGNRVLKRIGRTMLRCIRKTDIACRYGGEEFSIILPNTNKKAAFLLGKKLLKMIAALRFKRKITLSGGISEYPEDTTKHDRTLFKLADKALYYSKENGKNRLTIYFDEKRRLPRVGPRDIGLAGKAHADGSAIVIENISAKGMKIELNDIVSRFNNEKIKLRLDFVNDESITVDGRIAYMYPGDEKRRSLGLTFVNFIDKIDSKIKKSLSDKKKNK